MFSPEYAAGLGALRLINNTVAKVCTSYTSVLDE